MTLVVCPNLAVDRVVAVPALRAGATMRGRALVQQTGGKGANVMRALRALGGEGVLTGFAAGKGGALIEALAAGEGLDLRAVRIGGEARVSTVVLAADGPATRLFEYGPRIGRAEELELLAAVRGAARGEARARGGAPDAATAAPQGEWAVVTGAVPPGASDGFYGELCAALREDGYRVLVDATAEQLAGALRRRPALAKVNRAEATSVVGAADPHELCRRLVAAGARGAVVTLGKDGAVALLDAAFEVSAPAVEVVNTTGSGDVFAAALVLALGRDEPVEAALAAAAGAAAANAADPLTGHFDTALARELAGRAAVTSAAPAHPSASTGV